MYNRLLVDADRGRRLFLTSLVFMILRWWARQISVKNNSSAWYHKKGKRNSHTAEQHAYMLHLDPAHSMYQRSTVHHELCGIGSCYRDGRVLGQQCTEHCLISSLKSKVGTGVSSYTKNGVVSACLLVRTISRQNRLQQLMWIVLSSMTMPSRRLCIVFTVSFFFS